MISYEVQAQEVTTQRRAVISNMNRNKQQAWKKSFERDSPQYLLQFQEMIK